MTAWVDCSSINVRFTVTSPSFRSHYLPTYASKGAAGLDLHACIDSSLHVAPGVRIKVPTGIAVQLPGRHVIGLVYARSGLAWRHGLALPNGVGVIDSDYSGEVQVLLVNFGTTEVQIAPGDRIAQLVVAPIYMVDLVRVDKLEETERGDAGFGSTGR